MLTILLIIIVSPAADRRRTRLQTPRPRRVEPERGDHRRHGPTVIGRATSSDPCGCVTLSRRARQAGRRSSGDYLPARHGAPPHRCSPTRIGSPWSRSSRWNDASAEDAAPYDALDRSEYFPETPRNRDRVCKEVGMSAYAPPLRDGEEPQRRTDLAASGVTCLRGLRDVSTSHPDTTPSGRWRIPGITQRQPREDTRAASLGTALRAVASSDHYEGLGRL